MSRKGNCWDNAVMKRFFLCLTMKRVRHNDCANHAQAANDIRSVQEFLGRSDVSTTMIYAQVLKVAAGGASSPLDSLTSLFVCMGAIAAIQSVANTFGKRS